MELHSVRRTIQDILDRHASLRGILNQPAPCPDIH
jgi:hypothetical protein